PMPGAAGMPGASLGLTVPVDILPFHFQPRRVSVDWRRFSAIDVERVAREVDVAVLQEHIGSVTFCNLDGERCPHCGQPADPILLKVLRMAQLSIEYLLHCQERLGTSLAMHAQRLQAAHAKLACTQQQAAEQAAQLRGAKEESRRWKKLIATQQLFLQAGPNTYCKVCDHTLAHGTSDFLCFAERQKMKQVKQMEDEVEELKVKLQETQQQLEAEREAEKLRREQKTERACQREEERRRDLEGWKEEERMKLHEEIDGLRQLFLTAFKDVASRSSAVEGKLQELQAREAVVSNLGTLQNEVSSVVPMSLPLLHIPGGAFGWRWTPIHAPMCASALWISMDAQVQVAMGSYWCRALIENKVVISACFCTAALVPLLPSQAPFFPAVTWQVTKVLADEESSAPTFTPDREEAALGGKQRLLEALQRNPNFLKQFRPILEEVLEEKLESMGVKRVAKGISTRTYKSLQALVRLQQQQKAEKFPGLLHLRDELIQAVMGKVRRCKKPSTTLPQQLSIIPGEVTS
ncbi:DZI1L protein, partial [Oceanites oceanicus]|nr:DZI1L protein [Oceanites oceanicus]